MQLIIPPLKPGDTGVQAENLIQAMILLADRGIIKALESPDRPTAAELKTLIETAGKDLANATIEPATTRLVGYFQIQQGLGDQLRGVVDAATAARLNEWLKKIGALDGEITFVVRGRVTGASKGQLVRAYAMGFRSAEQELGRTVIDGEGNYEIRYHPEKVKLGGKDAVNLRDRKSVV